ncbi:MAG: hypothetical protein IJ274_08960 [Lachnospiraceae bacterium]|nr:hypothetical protein [Lachnospiraceae bacterium]
MNVNGITNVTNNVTDAYSAYGAKAPVAKEAEKSASKAATEGVVYEPSKRAQELAEQAIEDKKTVKLEKNQALKAQLQADSEARMAQLQSIVLRTINKQAETYGQANDIWSVLSSGNFTVDAATKAQAQADIAEDGYWGVEATSSRIVDFAIALCGDDKDKLEEMKEAFEKGFKQAEKTWGGELPDICQRTYDKVFEKFDNLINPQEEAAVATE